MNASEFRKTAVRNGYASTGNVRDYMELHEEPYTESDLYAVYRLDNYREVRDNMRIAQGDAVNVRKWSDEQ